jgi:hypothetical protein
MLYSLNDWWMNEWVNEWMWSVGIVSLFTFHHSRQSCSLHMFFSDQSEMSVVVSAVNCVLIRLSYAVTDSDGRICIEARQSGEILRGVWRLPEVSTHVSVSERRRNLLRDAQILRPVGGQGTKMYRLFCTAVGRVSSVGIATRYGLDGLGIESRW